MSDIFYIKLAEKGLDPTEVEHFIQLRTWSARIRFLVMKGLPDNEIAKLLQKRQQHVRSVREKQRIPREKFDML